MAARGAKPKPAHLRLIDGTHRTTRRVEIFSGPRFPTGALGGKSTRAKLRTKSTQKKEAPMHEIADDDPLPEEFVRRFVAAWAAQKLPADVLADAMLSTAVNHIGETAGRAEAVRILRDLADLIEREG